MANPVIVVVGAGPGVGMAVARRFATAGYDLALIGRSMESVEPLGKELQDAGYTVGWTGADVTDVEALTGAVSRFGGFSGSIDHLHFNPSAFRQKTPLELSVEELLADVHLGVGALLTAVQAARPFMASGARITATGSMAGDKPWEQAASLGVQKAGLRNLMQSIDQTLAPDGIRAVTITVTGTLGEGTPFDASYVADAIYDASQTDPEFWVQEVRFTGRHD